MDSYLRKLLETNNEIHIICYKTPSFVHIRSVMTRLLMNHEKPILLNMTKNRKHHLWNARKITQHRTKELLL